MRYVSRPSSNSNIRSGGLGFGGVLGSFVCFGVWGWLFICCGWWFVCLFGGNDKLNERFCSRSEETKEIWQVKKTKVRIVRIIGEEVWIITSFSAGHSKTRSQQAFSFLLQLLPLQLLASKVLCLHISIRGFTGKGTLVLLMVKGEMEMNCVTFPHPMEWLQL